MHGSGASTCGNGLFAMAIRHEIQNLTRRGNVYYWRPRVPTTFSGGGWPFVTQSEPVRSRPRGLYRA